MTSSFPHGRIPFVGRRDELRRLAGHRAQLEGNRERARHLIVVEGFSGVGKTALVQEFLSTLDGEGRSFTPRGAYSAYLRRPALAPLLDALDDLFVGHFAQRHLLSLFSDTTYHPLLARLPLLSGSIGFDAQTTNFPAPAAVTLAALIGSVLSHAARFRPVVLLLDDLQWSFEEDLQGLAALNAGLHNAPVLLLGTIRREAADSESIRESLGAMSLDHIYVSSLEPKEIAELVTEMHGAQVSYQLAADVARASEGVPSRAVELLRVLVDQGMLTADRRGVWRLSPSYNRRLLVQEFTFADRLRGLESDERRLLLLLNCAGGVADRSELAGWFRAVSEIEGREITEKLPEEALDRLELHRLVKPVIANPSQVTFAHDSISAAERELRDGEGLRDVACMIISNPDLRSEIGRWTCDRDLLRAILRALPEPGSEARREVLDNLRSSSPMYALLDDREHLIEVFDTILAERALLTPRELASVLSHAYLLAHYGEGHFTDAVEKAEEFYRLTASEPECANVRAESCICLANARYYSNTSTDVSALIQEAFETLHRITGTRERMRVEMMIEHLRVAIVPVVRLRDTITPARRYCYLAEQLGLQEEKFAMLGLIAVYVARQRDDEQLRVFCNDLLRELRGGFSGMAHTLFDTVVKAVRGAMSIGDIFLAREVFEALSSRWAPLEYGEFVRYCYLIALFSLSDGKPALAIDAALSGREEYIRCSTTAHSPYLGTSLVYAGLQILLMQSMVAAGRYAEALEINETMLRNRESNLPDSTYVLQLFNGWLRWRCLLPVDAPISLAWPRGLGALEAGGNIYPVKFNPSVAAEAGESFRRACRETVDAASPPSRFFVRTLLATLECAEGNFDAAQEALDGSIAACEEMYEWRFDLENRISAITLRLRRAQSEPGRADELVADAIERARELFVIMSEKGFATRIGQLTTLLREEAARVTDTSHRDLPAQVERLGNAAEAAAHVVMRNSRSEEAGPIDRARLFVMGPLRLMRPHSYMELSESAFGREAARTLLTALVAAKVLDSPPTREELADCIAPKARTPEQQKKALYNAASAARAACGSTNSILALGANSVELNTNPDLEGSVWVDALEIVRAVRRAGARERAGEMGGAFDEYQRALMLARKGTFAADIYAEWIDAARDRIREDIRQASLSVARIALRTGLYQAGIEAISVQLTRDQYDEEAHRALIRLYKESGNRLAALKQIDKCRKLIKREFGVEPEAATMKLRQELLALEAG
jgi:DNA-binding SARP family transcriptional activator